MVDDCSSLLKFDTYRIEQCEMKGKTKVAPYPYWIVKYRMPVPLTILLAYGNLILWDESEDKTSHLSLLDCKI